jgi:hypothetical protein
LPCRIVGNTTGFGPVNIGSSPIEALTIRKESNMHICIDFDGTIVKHAAPQIGAPVPGAIDVMKELQAAGHQLILFTMRSDGALAEAVEHCSAQGIEFFGVNINPTQVRWTNSPKAHGDLFIDDRALGCPLVTSEDGSFPYVDWVAVRKILVADVYLENEKVDA